MRTRGLPLCLAAVAWLSFCPSPWSAERAPIFEGAVIFSGGETQLHLTDAAAPLSLPAVFAGWVCYIDETQRANRTYVRKVTCGGKWGFVDTFTSCDSKHPHSVSTMRLRQPIDGPKEAVDAAEKVTITLGCNYDGNRR